MNGGIPNPSWASGMLEDGLKIMTRGNVTIGGINNNVCVMVKRRFLPCFEKSGSDHSQRFFLIFCQYLG